jgi:hypothetical protein
MATIADEREYLLSVLGMTVDNTNLSLAQLNALARLPLEVRQLSPLFDNTGKFNDGSGPANVADIVEPDYANLLSVGEEVALRDLVTGQTAALASGSVGLSYFTARKTEVSTQGTMLSGTTAAAATPTLCKFGVYSVASNGDLTLVASTVNDTTLFASTGTTYLKSWTSSFTKIAGQRYAFAQIVVSGVARPIFAAVGAGVGVFSAPLLAAQFTGQTDLPASITAASLVFGSCRHYGVVLP